MAGQSIEDWLAMRLGEVDDDALDSDEVSFTAAAVLDAVDGVEDEPVDDPLTVLDRNTIDAQRTPVAMPRGVGGAPALIRPDGGVWSRDGDTLPLPDVTDPFASAASQHGARAVADLNEPSVRGEGYARSHPPAQSDEDTLADPDLIAKLESRMPGRAFDEVFPHPAGNQRPETTAALLASSGSGPVRSSSGTVELLDLDEEAAPGGIHNEPTHISSSASEFADADDFDNQPTQISQAPTVRQPPPRSMSGSSRSVYRDVDDDEPYPVSVLAWTASTLGVLLFGAVLIVAALAAAQYFDLLGLEVLDLDMLPRAGGNR